LNPTSNDMSMIQIDQASGALSEVAGSPFAVPATGPNAAPSQPLSIRSLLPRALPPLRFHFPLHPRQASPCSCSPFSSPSP
jgi:hypothetical protein